MSDNDTDDKTDNISERIHWGRRSFLKGLIASGVGGLSGALYRPGSGIASEGNRIKKNGKYVVEQTRKVSII